MLTAATLRQDTSFHVKQLSDKASRSGMQFRSIILLIHFIIFISAVSIAGAQLDLWAHECSDAYGNYTSKSTYKSNLDKLLTNISTTNNIPYGFYNFSSGEDPDGVNAIALCRGDVVKASDCHACLNFLISNLTGSCPTQMEAIGWAEKCMLRYSTRSILGGVWSNGPLFNLATGVDAAGDVGHFADVVSDLLMSLPNKTADGDSRLKFATGEATVNGSHKVYGMMQCTPDLIQSDCLGCLYWGMYYVLHPDTWQTGTRILLPSCSIRYESQKFYLLSPPRAAKPPSPARSGEVIGFPQSRITLIAVVVGLACLFVFVVFLVLFYLRRRTNPGQTFQELGKIEFSVIRDATNNFSEDNECGRGGFGVVYKCTLDDGKYIAVKRLKKSTTSSDREFKNEVEIAARIQHTNLAEIIGYCIEGEERLLIFEFISNGSLDNILFDAVRRAELVWERRFIIIKGIAEGLQYLHQYCRTKIIHRDLKLANVLLDEDMKPKITDFGNARLFPDDVTHAYTLIPIGTRGYAAPEYVYHREYSAKSDVFSFGVMVLEIVAGRKNILNGEALLTKMAWGNWRNNTSLQTVDPTIASVGSRHEMERCLHVALLCVQESASSRPQMSRVLFMLNGGESSLESPARPPNVGHSGHLPPPVNALLQRESSQLYYSAPQGH